jgi:glucose/arabinose dehydrogenase
MGDRPRRRTSLAVALAALLLGVLGTGIAQAAETTQGGPVDVRLRRVLGGYEWPVFVTSDGHPGRMFIVEQPGRIRAARLVDGAWTPAGTFLDIRDRVIDPRSALQEQGLLGLAFHPDVATNGLLYVWYTRQSSDPARDGDLVLAELRRTTALRADPTSHRTLFVIDATYGYHNGGWLAFGPDGYLYLAVGDGGGVGDPERKAQDRESRQGKLLRLDPLDPDGAGPARFRVPPDNPYVGAPGDDLVWSIGLRNPWRASFDRVTGDLWIGDVGQAHYEEVSRVSGPAAGRGTNFGWRKCEGAHRYTGYPDPPRCDRPATTLPVIEMSHDVADPACAAVGGYVYRGSLQPALVGRYVFADFCSRRIWNVPTDFDDPRHRALPPAWTIRQIPMSFGEDAAGELYVTTLEGNVMRVVVAP